VESAVDLSSYILKAAPEVILFAALALGHAVGRIKLGNFSLGGVAGSLIIALLLGQLTRVELPDALKAVCFALFIYAVGFKSGPEFFGGLNRSSLKLVASSVVQCLCAALVVILIARLCSFGKGFAAGIGAGALTQTAMMGTAGNALARLSLPADQLSVLNSEMAIGFAITYIFGTVGVIIFVRSVAPKLLGVNVKQAARDLESSLSDGGTISRPGYITPFVPVVSRAFEVDHRKISGRTLAELEQRLGRATVERVVRDGETVELKPELVLKPGDLLGISGRLGSVLSAGQLIGEEVESKEALSFPLKVVSVAITDKRITGHTLRQVRDSFPKEDQQGVYVLSLKRQGLPLPILLRTVVRRGDVVELVGRPAEVDRVANVLGYTDASGERSDLAYHATAIATGTLLGLLSVTVGGIPVTLGVGGGVLVAGLCFGWFHARYPALGSLPGPAQWVLSEFGLSAFAAAVGLAAGPRAIVAIQEHGIALLLAGAAVTLVPLIVTLYLGRFILKLNPVILLGALCGGQTVAAALSAVNEETESITPVLGFTVTYAVSNVLLAIWGPVIVALT
jgi:putative transport protein